MSFRDRVVAGRWVSLARKLLRKQLDVYDYRETPEMDPDLDEALHKQIASRDVFVAVLDKDYLETPSTLKELECAILLATGSPGGSLKNAKCRPLVYLLVRDDAAVDWVKKNQAGFTYLDFEDFEFGEAEGAGFQPINSGRWDDWTRQIEHRLSEIDGEPTGCPGSREILLLGCARDAFEPPTAKAVSHLLDLLRPDIKVVEDNWRQRKADADCYAIRKVVAGTAGSIVIHPSNDETREENLVKDDPPGDALRSKLQQIGLTRDEAKGAISRTLFWIPNSEAVDPVRDIASEGPNFAGPLFAAGQAADVAAWVRDRLGGAQLVLKAEDGLGNDVGPKFRDHVAESFRVPLELDLVGPAEIGRSIRRTVGESVRLLVLIHDLKVDALSQQPRRQILQRAYDFDNEIEKALAGASGTKIARAVLLIRYGEDVFPEIGFFAKKQWTLLPLDPQAGYRPDERRLRNLREALWP